MSIIDQLATSLGRRDEEPNIELAVQIVKAGNKKAVQEMVDALSGKDKNIQHDCIKVLYTIGELNPDLIAIHIPVFTALLHSKDNRLQWGAMTALYTLSGKFSDQIHVILPAIMDAANKGSVITKDNAVKILIAHCAHKKHATEAFLLLKELLLSSPTNQLPMYAELTLPVITPANKTLFIEALTNRLPEIEKESKRKRVEKVIQRLR